jgi:exonuclease SbcC
MRLVSLKLKNYRQFKNAEIEFPDGVIGIVGLNGAGKSTIIEALAWVLYGNAAARTEKQGIKRAGAPPSSAVEATLELEISGTAYKITRLLKGQSQTGTGSISANGKILADSVRGLDKEIQSLLGMDYPSFTTSFLAKQKELNALSDLTPKQRKDVIIRMLRIDSIDKAIDLIRKEARDKKLEVEIKRKSLKDDNALVSEKQALVIQIEKHRKSVAEIEKEVKKLEKEQSAYTSKFNEERKVYEQYNKKNTQKTEVEARLSGLRKREEELNEELEEIGKFEKELKILEKEAKEYSELEKKEKKLSVAKESQMETIDSKIIELRSKYKEIQEREKMLKPGEPCPTCGQPLKDFEKIKEHFAKERVKIEADGKRLKTLKGLIEQGKTPKKEGEGAKFDPVEYNKILERMEKLEPSAERFPKVQAKVEGKKKVEAGLKKITAEISSFDGKLKATLIEIKEIPYDAKRHQKITDEFNSAQKVLDGRFNERNETRLSLGKLEGELTAKEKEIKENSEARKSIEETIKSQEERNRLIDLMIEYRTHLIARIQPELADISSRLFTELTSGKYQGVELDEDYEMHIYDSGIKYPIGRFSGGEADLANLCLRLAISQLISAPTGTDAGFIMLDEIFGSQDLLRKGAIMDSLTQLSKQFRQIILITHVDEIKDSLEHIIEVAEDEDGVSHVKQ